MRERNGPNGWRFRPRSVGNEPKNCGRFSWSLEAHLIPNPIRKVLSSMNSHGVKALLMGGQACVLFGAAEFSYDSDFAILCEPDNLERLKAALEELQATRVYVPALEARYLQRGHGVHFRCAHADCAGMRVDVMSKMRGVEPFPILWERRSTFETDDGENYETLAITDLVLAKKTQRDKDWPMIARLVRTHYYRYRTQPNAAQVEFWLRELRDAPLLREACAMFTEAADFSSREAVITERTGADDAAIEAALQSEQARERALDRAYWQPLRAELASLRHAQLRANR